MLALALGCGFAHAASPPGPRLAIVKLRFPERTELLTVDAGGGTKTPLYAAAAKRVPAVYPFSAPSWSPDGTRIAFTAMAGQVNTRFSSYPRTQIAITSEAGGPPEAVPGTLGGFNAVFAPDGIRIAFSKTRKRLEPNDNGGADTVFESTSIWLADLSTGAVSRLTQWRNRLHRYPSSFSPDGLRLAFTRHRADREPEAMELSLNGSAETLIARNALEPMYSHDGRQIAFVRGPVKKLVRRTRDRSSSTVSVGFIRLTDIFVRGLDDSSLRRVTKTPHAAELTPTWDPSGQRLAYLQVRQSLAGQLFPAGNAVMEINADGTCPTEILSERLAVYSAAIWQPGPGREAGPLSC